EQGERLDYLDRATGKPRVRPGTQQHSMTGLPCLLTGECLARYFLWDGIRALDYLLTRKEVDPRRIAVAGNSGGGTHAGMLAAIEPRIATSISSCWFTSWSTVWRGQGPQDGEQLLPSLLAKGLDYPDFALSIAPRPLLIESAVRDFFPIEGARATYREAKTFYAALGQPDSIAQFEYDDEHGWFRPRREAAYRWLEQRFLDREAKPEDADLKVARPEELRATPSGQIAVSLPGETVLSLNRRRAEDVYSRRSALRIQA